MIALLAPAKVNLCLRVTGKTDAGLHNLDSIVVFCAFGDTVTIQSSQQDSFALRGPFGALLADDKAPDNLVVAARDAFRAAGGDCGPVAITLDKHIPVGAGLGGGSSDAAATLRALNQISQTPLSPSKLFEISASLGSDVPVCLAASPHRIDGTGDIIHPLGPIHAGALLLVNPLIPLSTAAVFKHLSPPYNDRLPEITDFDAVNLCRFGNDLLPAAQALVPEINQLLNHLRQISGCRVAQMSGSGASCFGIFDDFDAAAAAGIILNDAGIWAKPTRLFSAND